VKAGTVVQVANPMEGDDTYRDAIGIVVERVVFPSTGDSDFYIDVERSDGEAYIVFINGHKQAFFVSELKKISEPS
jgi:hypothetical protein